MFRHNPYQRHGAYQRRDRLSLEVSEQELLSTPVIASADIRHLPQLTVLPALDSPCLGLCPGGISSSQSQHQSLTDQMAVVEATPIGEQCPAPTWAIAFESPIQTHDYDRQQFPAPHLGMYLIPTPAFR